MVDFSDIYKSMENTVATIDENLQIGPPGAEALIPLNPGRMPGHALATAFSDGMRFGDESLLKPLENVQVVFEYLSSSQSDAHYNSRFGQVCHDTAIVNLLAETCGVPGEILAGDYANQAANEYVQQMIEDQNYPLEDDYIARSFRIKLRGGPGSTCNYANSTGASPALFNGTGLFKEHLAPGQRTNPIFELATCRRANDRPIWTYKFFSNGNNAFIMPRCFYSLRLIELINLKLNNRLIAISLMPFRRMFYAVSCYYFIKYCYAEIANVKRRMAERKMRNKLISLMRERYIKRNRRPFTKGRGCLF